jgi:hypothetical protein
MTSIFPHTYTAICWIFEPIRHFEIKDSSGEYENKEDALHRKKDLMETVNKSSLPDHNGRTLLKISIYS